MSRDRGEWGIWGKLKMDNFDINTFESTTAHREDWLTIFKIMINRKIPKTYSSIYPWQANEIIGEILRDASENRRKVNMFVDNIMLHACKNIFLNSDFQKQRKNIEMIVNGLPKKEFYKTPPILEEINKTKGISLRILLKHYNNLKHFVISGDSYIIGKSHKEFNRGIIFEFPKYITTFSFNDPKEAEKIRTYWRKEIKALETISFQ